MPSQPEQQSGPKRQGLVLAALILVAAVANLNLAVANVALPDIGKAFSAGQTALDLVAIGYSLGLAASVLVVTLPLAAVALFMAWRFVPAHVNETTEPVDNLGGVLSIVLVAALVLAINIAPVPNKGTLAIGLGAIAIAATVAFVIRQR